MSSEIGVLLVHIDFPPTNCFFDYFSLDLPLHIKLGRLPAYFPKFLLCYSLYSHFPQKTETKVVVEDKKQTGSGLGGKKQVMQQSRDSSFATIFKPDKKFTHSEEAFHALKEVSLKMKNNFGKFGKHIKNITRSDKDQGKTLLSSISTQLMYIILNSHQPLQMKMDELFIKIHDKMKNTLNPDLHSDRHPKSVCVRCGSDDTPATPTVCACGEEVEFCRCQDVPYNPLHLHQAHHHHQHQHHHHHHHHPGTILIPLEGEEEIYPTTRKAVRTVE